MINVKCSQLGFYLSGTKFLFPMRICSQNTIIQLQNFGARFRKQLVVPEPDPEGILLPGILDTLIFAATQKLPFSWI